MFNQVLLETKAHHSHVQPRHNLDHPAQFQ